LATPKLLFKDIKLPTTVSRGTPLTTTNVQQQKVKDIKKLPKAPIKATSKPASKPAIKPVIKTQLPVQITKTVAPVLPIPPKEVIKAEAIAADIGGGDRLPQKAKAPTAPTPTTVQPETLSTIGKPAFIGPKPPPPLIQTKANYVQDITAKGRASMLPDMGPGDRLLRPTIKTPSAQSALDKQIVREEVRQASNVSLLPGKAVLPVEDRLSEVVKNIAAQETTSRFVAGPPPPEAVVEAVGTTPPSEAEIENILQKTADRAAAMETEARRQLFYRGQVKRRGGIRMLFGKYAFPTPRKLAPATATTKPDATIVSAVQKGLTSWKDVPEEYRLVPDYLRPPQYSEKAYTAKENIAAGYTAMGGEERWR